MNVAAASYLDAAFGDLAPLMGDDLVEVAINPDGRTWVERRSDRYMRPAELELPQSAIKSLAAQIANAAGISFSEKKPVFSVAVTVGPWHVRAQVVSKPAVQRGLAISLRFFSPAATIIDPKFLYGRQISAADERRKRNLKMRELAEGQDILAALAFCVEEKLNVIVSGGTSSGKTMVARYLQKQIGDHERIVTIEDAPDLLPGQPNQVQMVSLANDDYRSPDKLLQASLRMRPDRIILSEIRGADAYTFLKAINTGHGGSITTLHADTAELAVSRLAQAALEAAPAMSFHEMTDYIGQSIDVIIHTARAEGERGITELFLPGEDLKKGDRL